MQKVNHILEVLDDSGDLEIKEARERTSLGNLFEDSLSLLEEIGAVDIDWEERTVQMTDLGSEIMKLSEEEGLAYTNEIKVLFVDDDYDALELAEEVMKKHDDFLELTTTSSPKEALELLDGERYDAIVSDYLMSEMNGIDLLQNVREQNGEVPFIILTGKGDEDIAMKALNTGADYYFKKGGSPKDQFKLLTQTIKKVVSQKKIEEWSGALHSFLESDLRDKTKEAKEKLDGISIEKLPNKEKDQIKELKRDLEEDLRLIDNLLESRENLSELVD